MSRIKWTIISILDYLRDFFTKGHERTLLAKKNITASFGIKGVSIIINLALIPLTINYINPSKYGIWLTLSSIITWFSFFDIGFGHGLRNRFAEAKADGDFEKARMFVSTTYAVLFLIFTCVWLIFFVVNFFVDWSSILNAPKEMATELSRLALIVISFFCLQFVLKIINSLLLAVQKSAIADVFSMLGQLFILLIIFILTKTTDGSLIYLGFTMSIVPVIILILSSFILFQSLFKDFKPSIRNVNFKFTGTLLNLGIKFFLIQLGSIIIFQTSNIVITNVLSPEDVTVYNIAFRYFFVLSMIFMLIVTPFWSAFTEAFIKEEFNWMQNIINKLKKIWLIIIPIGFGMLLISNWVYKLWIGDIVSIPFSISISMTAYVLLYTRFNMFINLINGIGKIRLQLYLNLSVAIFFIPTAIYLCKWFGLNGIVWANILVAIIYAFFSEKQINRLLARKAEGIWNK